MYREGELSDMLAAEAGDGFATIFVNLPYGAIMQFGGTKSHHTPTLWGDIPARPFPGFAQKQADAVPETVRDWTAGLFR